MSEQNLSPRKVFNGEFKFPNVIPFWEQQMLFEQYQLIKTKGKLVDSIELPPEHSALLSLVFKSLDDFDRFYGSSEEHYVYLTIKRGYHSNFNPHNRGGWHIDGYGTEDVNYVWCDAHPTEYVEMESPTNLCHEECLSYLEREATEYQIHEIKPYQLYDIGRAVHRVSSKEFDGMRTFIKISFSEQPYSHLGNKINPKFIKEYKTWNWVERQKQRNCPNVEFLPAKC